MKIEDIKIDLKKNSIVINTKSQEIKIIIQDNYDLHKNTPMKIKKGNFLNINYEIVMKKFKEE